MEYLIPLLTGWGMLNVMILLVAAVVAFAHRKDPITFRE